MSDKKRIPQHVAIIMDGNGRWAKQRGLERYEGHAAGIEPIRASSRAAIRHGVAFLTLYAFSTENWGRPAQEVDALMELFCQSVIHETPDMQRQGIRLRTIGDRSRFSEKVQAHLAQAEELTAGGDKLTLTLALNYSSRDEITRAARPGSHRRSDHRPHARHGRRPGPRPGNPHQRRTPAQQFPALAGFLRRTLVPGGAVARFHRGRVRPGDGGIRPARTAVRAGQVNEVED